MSAADPIFQPMTGAERRAIGNVQMDVVRAGEARRMRDLAAERPPDFTNVMLPEEKKLLQQVLENSRGVSRKRAAAPRKRKTP